MATNIINSLQSGDNIHVFSMPYGTCSTKASTPEKVVSSKNNFTLEAGARITIKFTEANNVVNPTLNIKSLGAKPIYWNGSALPSSQYWPAGATLEFVYNGAQFDLIGVAKDNNTTYSAGAGIDLSNGQFSNGGVRSVGTGTTNGTISVNTGGTVANVAVKGLGSAAYTNSSAYDPAGTAAAVKNDLLNGAGAAYDTLKELGDLIDDNEDAITALNSLISGRKVSAGSGLTGGGALASNITISHADTSSQSSVSASGRKYITGVTLDTYGHVTGLKTGTETVTNTDQSVQQRRSTSDLYRPLLMHMNYGDYGASLEDKTGNAYFNETISACPATGEIRATQFTGNLSGKASSADVVAWTGVTGKPNYYDAKAIKGISRSGTTFTYTCMDGSTGTFTQQDNNTNTSHSHSAGVGLTGSGNAGTSGTYTYKVNLVNETVASNAASYTAGGSSKFYAVQLDKNNKLGVYVPWTDTNTTYTLSSFGITATAAELNKLDGVTATTTELNYVDGVTSNIQTQLNSMWKLNSTGTAIPEGSDLNTYTTPGLYGSKSDAVTKTLTNLPSTVTGSGFKLVVMDGYASGTTMQLLLGYGSRFYLRGYKVSSSEWGEWEKAFKDLTASTSNKCLTFTYA